MADLGLLGCVDISGFMSFTCPACKVLQDFVQQVQVDERGEEKSLKRWLANGLLGGFLGKKRLEMTYFCKCQQNLGFGSPTLNRGTLKW